MTLIDTDRAERLYEAMGPGTEISGGSGANTMAGVASFGGRAAFLGRVRDDELGRGVRARHPCGRGQLRHGSRARRVPDRPVPDRRHARRGADAQHLPRRRHRVRPRRRRPRRRRRRAGDVPRGVPLGPARRPRRRSGSPRRLAHEAGRRVALTLSDGFCVDRHRADFLALLEHDVDILFANESEICSLYEVDDFDDALQRVRNHCEIAALTRSAKGSLIVRGDEVHLIDAHPVPGGVVDTTGAGDQYAAGFLYGFTHGHDLGTCGRLGALAASEVISHLGRPARDAARGARTTPDVLGYDVKLPRYRTGDNQLDQAIAAAGRPGRCRRRLRPRVRARRLGGPAVARPRGPRRPEARERRAQGDAVRVPRVRPVPGGAQGRDLRIRADPARRPALRPGPPLRGRPSRRATGW